MCYGWSEDPEADESEDLERDEREVPEDHHESEATMLYDSDFTMTPEIHESGAEDHDSAATEATIYYDTYDLEAINRLLGYDQSEALEIGSSLSEVSEPVTDPVPEFPEVTKVHESKIPSKRWRHWKRGVLNATH